MTHRMLVRRLLAVGCVLAAASMHADEPAKVEGTFVMAGADAKLRHVRAAATKLDENGKPGYAILLSARPAEGDIDSWRTAEPSGRGSFMLLLLETNGETWVAELGHSAGKSGRFGVVSELKAAAFERRGNRLVGHVRTSGEQEFSGDHYTVDLRFDAVLEEKK